MEYRLKPEEIEKAISSAYDSVNLINELRQKEVVSEFEQNRLEKNIEHLKIILTREWFYAELSQAQKNELNSIVA